MQSARIIALHVTLCWYEFKKCKLSTPCKYQLILCNCIFLVIQVLISVT